VYDKVFYSITAREIILEWDKNCLQVRFFLLDLDLDLDLSFLKRTWTRTWTCSLKVDLDLDLDLRIGDLNLDLAVAGLVTSLISRPNHVATCSGLAAMLTENVTSDHITSFAHLFRPIREFIRNSSFLPGTSRGTAGPGETFSRGPSGEKIF